MKMNVDQIAPGVDMDTLVAKYIFGWSEDKSQDNNWFDPCVNLWRPTPDNSGITPSWSRFPSHALQVASQMEKEGCEMAIYNATAISLPKGTYEVMFTKGIMSYNKARGDFCTALCRAALKTR